jgi:rubrerythrin
VASELQCTACARPLLEQSTPAGARWICARCGGAAEHRQTLLDETIDGTADAVHHPIPADHPPRRCPRCGQPMGVATVRTDPPGGTEVDVCDACDLVWLDMDARAQLPLRLSPDRADELGDEATDAGAVIVTPPERCPTCGAPWEVVDGTRCHWCGASLLATVRRAQP